MAGRSVRRLDPEEAEGLLDRPVGHAEYHELFVMSTHLMPFPRRDSRDVVKGEVETSLPPARMPDPRTTTSTQLAVFAAQQAPGTCGQTLKQAGEGG
jgi:hypothetical protein